MYCAKCGANNDENAFRCISCGSELARPGRAMPYDVGLHSQAPNATMALVASILATLLCCMPCGIVGIVYAAMAMSKVSSGDYGTAQRYIKTSNIWTLVGAGIGLLVLGGYLVLGLAGVATNGIP